MTIFSYSLLVYSNKSHCVEASFIVVCNNYAIVKLSLWQWKLSLWQSDCFLVSLLFVYYRNCICTPKRTIDV